MRVCVVAAFVLTSCIAAHEVGVLKTKNETRKQIQKKNTQDDKHITTNMTIINKTDILTESKITLYEKWSKWSRCRNCRKTRKRRCMSKTCNFSVQYEEKPCGRLKCKRKNRKKNRINIIENMSQTKSIVPQLKWLQKVEDDWSAWSPCSDECLTKRYKYCRKPGRCPKKRTEQKAYCFTNGSLCEKWVQSIIKDAYGNRRKYDIQTTEYKKKRKPRVKKCGVMYKNITSGITSNMLRIIGGRETLQSKWPWHVALMNKYQEVFCGGTLISPKWILTAAHCVRSILYASLNEYDISYDDGSEQKYRITKAIIHPKFNQITIDNDIALLKLPNTVQLPYACLPVHEPLVGETCTIMGWGKRRMDDYIGSRRLREAQLPIVSKDICLRSYRRYVITENMFCAGYKRGGTDTCSGDSGGGLLCPPGDKKGWTIQGITSFGEGCGKKGKYGIYVTIHNYLEWIKSVMANK